MRKQYNYEELFRIAFPEWKDEVPQLRNTWNVESNYISDSEEELDQTDLVSATYILWIMTSDSGSTNLAVSSANAKSIQKIQFYDGLNEFDYDPNLQFSEDAIHFLPNANWVFTIDPTILPSLRFCDPVLITWMCNTESFGKTCNQKFSDSNKVLLNSFIASWTEFKYKDWLMDVEMPHLRLLGKMHNYTLLIDKNLQTELRTSTGNELKELEKHIYSIAGKKFNILSPFEVSNVLFGKLGLTPKYGQEDRITSRHKITRHRDFAPTNSAALESVDHPIVDLIKQYRRCQKELSNWLSFDPEPHPNFETISTATGRISTSSPNLQNIPLNLRQLFVCKKKLISVDYCQLELRILAALAHDEYLQKACENDIHTIVAEELKCTRDEAKRALYATIYGMADTRVNDVLKIFPAIREFAERTVSIARAEGGVRTISGKWRVLPNIKSENPAERRRDERMALNTKVQGSAADFVKYALVNISKECNDVVPLVQIHDEWLFEGDDVNFEKLKNAAECGGNLQLGNLPVKIAEGLTYGTLEDI